MTYPALHLDIAMTRYRRLHALHLPGETFARFYSAITDAIDALRALGHPAALVHLDGQTHLLVLDIDPDNPHTDAAAKLMPALMKEADQHG
jgi:hypothetical protein